MMIEVLDDPDVRARLRSVKVLETKDEVEQAILLNDLTEDNFNGEGGRYSDENGEVALFLNEEETKGILEFGGDNQ